MRRCVKVMANHSKHSKQIIAGETKENKQRAPESESLCDRYLPAGPVHIETQLLNSTTRVRLNKVCALKLKIEP